MSVELYAALLLARVLQSVANGFWPQTAVGWMTFAGMIAGLVGGVWSAAIFYSKLQQMGVRIGEAEQRKETHRTILDAHARQIEISQRELAQVVRTLEAAAMSAEMLRKGMEHHHEEVMKAITSASERTAEITGAMRERIVALEAVMRHVPKRENDR